MADAHSRLIRAHSHRPSLVERLSDILGINRFFLRHGAGATISTAPDILVSPAQCKVSWIGSIGDNELIPTKPILGRQRLWNLSQILWDEGLTRSFQQGLVFNLYLSPTDLHYLVSPATATVESVRRCAGRCWPIVFWKLGEVENERVVIVLRLEHEQKIAMVLVGSFLVRGIVFLPQPGDVVTKGEVIGGFKIGSTVFVVLESNQASPLVATGDRLLLGEPMARLSR
jgi:phosphatidylserine decarboxylase